MNTLRLFIVDDEALIRRGIRKGLASLQTVEVCGECENGTEAIQAILETRPDLVLLDVQMPDCSGIDVVRQIGVERMPMVVFVTAHDEYAVKAFELNAVDYLLKPFDEERLKDAVGRGQQHERHAKSTGTMPRSTKVRAGPSRSHRKCIANRRSSRSDERCVRAGIAYRCATRYRPAIQECSSDSHSK